MKMIDADAHVEESIHTWEYLEPEFYPRRPIPVTLPSDTSWGKWNAGWWGATCRMPTPFIMTDRKRSFATGATSRKDCFRKSCATTPPGYTRYEKPL